MFSHERARDASERSSISCRHRAVIPYGANGLDHLDVADRGSQWQPVEPRLAQEPSRGRIAQRDVLVGVHDQQPVGHVLEDGDHLRVIAAALMHRVLHPAIRQPQGVGQRGNLADRATCQVVEVDPTRIVFVRQARRQCADGTQQAPPDDEHGDRGSARRGAKRQHHLRHCQAR